MQNHPHYTIIICLVEGRAQNHPEYSRVPTNGRGWNNSGGLDIVIIINNREAGRVGIIEGVEEIVEAVS